MPYPYQRRAVRYVDVLVYRAASLDYVVKHVVDTSKITTSNASGWSKVRIKPNGTYSAPQPAHRISSRTVGWQEQAYAHAMQTGDWAGYLTEDEARYQERRAYDAEIARRAREGSMVAA